MRGRTLLRHVALHGADGARSVQAGSSYPEPCPRLNRLRHRPMVLTNRGSATLDKAELMANGGSSLVASPSARS
jgi:hypothetical protein